MSIIPSVLSSSPMLRDLLYNLSVTFTHSCSSLRPSSNAVLNLLFVYFACLHQSRLQRQRCDASVYSLASDGFSPIFMTISHDEVVKLSRKFDVLLGDLRVVLGVWSTSWRRQRSWIKNLTPERNDGGEMRSGVEMLMTRSRWMKTTF